MELLPFITNIWLELRLPDWQDLWDSRCPGCQDTLGSGKETRSTVAMGFCVILWDSAVALLLHGTDHHCLSQPAWSSCCAAQLPQHPLEHREAPAAVPNQAPCWSITAGDSPSPWAPFSRLTGFLFPAWVAAPQLFPSLSSTTILVNQRCSLLPWFDSKFSHFLLDRVRVTHPQPTPRASCTATGWRWGREHVPAFLKREWTASDPGNTRIQFVPKAAREVGFISHSTASFLPQTQFNFE